MTFHQDVGFQAPPPPNTVGDMSNMVNMLTGMRSYQAQTDVGSAYQQAIDPVTGRIDQAKLANALAASKSPWMVGPTGIQAGQSMEAQGRGTQAQLTAQQQQTSILNAFLNSFDMSKPVSADQVGQKIQEAVAGGYATPAYYNQWLQMRQHMDPSELGDVRPLIQAYKSVGLTAAEQAQYTMGPTVGQQADILKNLNREYSWTDKTTGQPMQGTYAQYLQSLNVNPAELYPGSNITINSQGQAVYGGGSGGGGAASGGPNISTVSTGREGAPSRYGQPSALPAPATVKASTDQYTFDQGVQRTLGSRIAPLESALSVLRSHPNMQTVGQDEVNRLKAVADAFNLNVSDMSDVNAYQVLSKQLEMYLQNNQQANRSDLALTQAQAANVHIGQARPAMMELLGKAVGYERLRAASYDMWTQQHGGDVDAAARESGQYAGRTATWQSKLDPVAFAVDEMDPAVVKKYVDGLSGYVNAARTEGSGAKWRFYQSRLEALKLYPWLKMSAPGQ